MLQGHLALVVAVWAGSYAFIVWDYVTYPAPNGRIINDSAGLT